MAASLALYEAQAPVGWHVGATDDAGQLVNDLERRWPHEEVEVQDAANDPVLQLGLCDSDIHAVAVQQHDPMRLPICSHHLLCQYNGHI